MNCEINNLYNLIQQASPQPAFRYNIKTLILYHNPAILLMADHFEYHDPPIPAIPYSCYRLIISNTMIHSGMVTIQESVVSTLIALAYFAS